MTSAATDPPVKTGGLWPVLERSIIGTVLGIPAVAAIGLAAALTALGVFIDLERIGTLGSIFKICYFSGCVLAIAWVRRRGLFGPMVQPPLLLAVTVPVVVLFGGGPPTGGRFSEQMLFVVLPLINGFPTMAITTLATVSIGVFRYLTQRPPARSRLGKSGAAKRPVKGSGSSPAKDSTKGSGTGSAKGSEKGSGKGAGKSSRPARRPVRRTVRDSGAVL